MPLAVTSGILYFCDLGYVVTLKMNFDYMKLNREHKPRLG